MKKITLVLMILMICAVFANAQESRKFKLKKVDSAKVSAQFLKVIRTEAMLKQSLRAKRNNIVVANKQYSIYKIEGLDSHVILKGVNKQEFEMQLMEVKKYELGGGKWMVVTCSCERQNDDCKFHKFE